MIRKQPFSRRSMLQASGGALLAGAAGLPAWAQQGPDAPYNPTPNKRLGQPQEGPDTPKITIYMKRPAGLTRRRSVSSSRRRLGRRRGRAGTALGRGLPASRVVDALEETQHAYRHHDDALVVPGGLDPEMNKKIVRGLPGRDEEIGKVKQTIVHMGSWAFRFWKEFLYHRATDRIPTVPGRGGAGMLDSTMTA